MARASIGCDQPQAAASVRDNVATQLELPLIDVQSDQRHRFKARCNCFERSTKAAGNIQQALPNLQAGEFDDSFREAGLCGLELSGQARLAKSWRMIPVAQDADRVRHARPDMRR
jgi:hypothetical protein